MGFVTCAETSNLEDREREQDAESRVEADVGSGASLVTGCHVLSSRAVFFSASSVERLTTVTAVLNSTWAHGV